MDSLIRSRDCGTDFSSNSIKRELENTYKGYFNKNVVNNDRLTGEIFTKDKLIKDNEYSSMKKERYIIIARGIIAYLFVAILIVLFRVLGVFDNIIFYFLLAVATVTAIVMITLKILRMDGHLEMKFHRLSSDIKKDFNTDNLKKMLRLKYNKKCKPGYKPKKEYPGSHIKKDVKDVGGSEVFLDNDQNIWSDGDIPTIGANKKGYEELGSEVQPKPWYKGDSNWNKHTCVWKGNPNNMIKGGLAGNQKTFETTIPCEFFPGYMTQK